MADGNVVPEQGPDIAQLKATYGKVYRVNFDPNDPASDVFYVRRLKRQEHRRIAELVESVEPRFRNDMAEEKIVDTAVVWPKLPTDFPSTSPTGYVPMLAAQILEVSGFSKAVEVTEV